MGEKGREGRSRGGKDGDSFPGKEEIKNYKVDKGSKMKRKRTQEQWFG